MTFSTHFSHKVAYLMSNETIPLEARLQSVSDYCSEISEAIREAQASSSKPADVPDRDGKLNVNRIVSSVSHTAPSFSPTGAGNNARPKPPYHSDLLDR